MKTKLFSLFFVNFIKLAFIVASIHYWMLIPSLILIVVAIVLHYVAKLMWLDTRPFIDDQIAIMSCSGSKRGMWIYKLIIRIFE